MKVTKVVSGDELLNEVCVGLTSRRLKLVQMSVLSTVERLKCCTSGDIVRHTGLSASHVDYVLGVLEGVNEVRFKRLTREERMRKGENRQTRRFVITPEGKKTLAAVKNSMPLLRNKRLALVVLEAGEAEEFEV